MTNVSSAIETITDRSAYWLATDADCGSPDTLESDGASFLDSVRSAALEYWDYNPSAERDDADSDARDQTDSCVPVYTHHLWRTFVDLAAYHEEIDDLGFTDMCDMASYALSLIGERLFVSLVGELIEAREEDEAAEAEVEEDSFDTIAYGEIVDAIGAENVIGGQA